MRPKNPVALFSKLYPQGESIKVSTAGNKIVLPTGKTDLLTTCNEFTGNPKLVSIAESPFGGLKGSGSPDYCPGTISVNSGDGVYLTDINGQNTTKTLTSGKLIELGNLSVDTENHTITEEFIIKNTSTANNPTIIDDCSTISLYGGTVGTPTSITSENGRLKVVGKGANSSGLKIMWTHIDLSTTDFLTFDIECSVNKYMRLDILGAGNTLTWTGSRFTLNANTKTRFVLPIKAAVGTVGAAPQAGVPPTVWTDCSIYIGTNSVDTEDITIYLGNVAKDSLKTSTIEIAVPDNLADTSTQIYTYDSTAYQLCRVDKLDSVYSNVSQTSANCTFLDGTKLDDVSGSPGAGRAVFPKGSAGDTKAGSSESITYSNNLGTDKRIGLKVALPPSDSGRTNFNSIRIKIAITYTDVQGNIVQDVSGHGKTGTIVGTVLKSNIAWSGFGTSYIALPPLLFDDGSSGSILAKVIPATNDITTSLNNIVGSNGGADAQKTPYFRTEGGRIAAYLGNASTGLLDPLNRIIAPSSVVLTEGVTNIVALSWSDLSASLYTNNFAPNNFTLAHTVNILSSAYPVIGSYTNFLDRNWNGSILEVVFYNRKITDEEFTTFKNGGLPANPVARYLPSAKNMGSTTYKFSNSTNASYGLQNVVYPWITIYSPNEKLLDIFRFTYKPKKLVIKRDETGTIYEVEIFPGNGPIYHGRMFHPQPTLDSNSDNIPNCLSINHEGSVAKLLKTYTFVDDWFTEVDLSTSSIVTNDYGITADSLDIIPYAISEGDSVSDINNHVLPVAETVSAISGNVSLVDVRGLNTIRVRDTAYTNAGECKVWDTVTTGNTDENTWKRVFTTDYTFTGDTVIENGLIKVVIPASTYTVKIYDIATTNIISYYSCIGTLSLISISADKVEFKFNDVGDFTTVISYSGTHWLCRGSRILSHDHMIFYPAAYDAITYQTNKRFMLINEQLYDAAVLKTSQIVTTVTAETVASFNITDSTIGIYITNKTPDSVRPVYTSGTTWSSFRITKENFKTLRRADVGSIPFNCSMFYFEAENLGLLNGAVYYTGTDAYPGSGNTGITFQVKDSKTYSNPISFSTGDYLVFMRAQSPGAGRLSLNLYSGVNVQKSVRLPSADTAFSLVSTTLSISSAEAQVIDNFKIYNGSTDPITIDYILFIPISLIKKYAQRALWQALPATKVIKKLPR